MGRCMSTPFPFCHPLSMRRQRGVTSLFVTLIGVTAAMRSGTHFLLAGNLQMENVAFNEAESAIGAAQNWLVTGSNSSSAGFTTYDGTNTPYLYPISYCSANPDTGVCTNGLVDPTKMSWSDSN